jgi:hypothetical protein
MQEFNEDYLWRVNKGNIPGHSVVRKFAERGNLTAAVLSDVWDFPTAPVYTYSATADIDTVSSSAAGDTEDMVIYGLDANFEEVKQTVTLTGQTKVTLVTPLIRVYRMIWQGAAALAGDVYCYVDGTITAGVPDTAADVRAFVTKEAHQTLMAPYTIPAGKVGFILGSNFTIARKVNAIMEITFSVRPFGKQFTTKARLSLSSTGTSQAAATLPAPIAVDQKSDLRIQVNSDTNATGATSTYTILLVDRDLVNLDAVFP